MQQRRMGELIREYSNGEVTIVWQPDLCIHATCCYVDLPQVFDPGKRPWVNPLGATTEEIIAQVDRCPSAALSYRWNNPQDASPNEEHHRKLERMYAAAPINAFFQPVMRVSKGQAVVTTHVRRDFFHAANAAHGALYLKMLDDAAFFAVNSLVPDVFVLTVSLNTYFVRPVSEGEVKAVGRVVHRSRRLYVAESQLTDSAGKEIARASGTFMPSDILLSPDIGYA